MKTPIEEYQNILFNKPRCLVKGGMVALQMRKSASPAVNVTGTRGLNYKETYHASAIHPQEKNIAKGTTDPRY